MFYDPQYVEAHYGKRDMNNMTLITKRYLNIKQNATFEMNIPIQLIIYYPKIEVDNNNVNFSVVYIGNIAKCQVILKNRCCKY